MVVSHLNKYIEYLETREIEDEDIDAETDIYEIEIYKKNHYIAIGKPKYTYTTKYKVVYFPIYLLKGFKQICGKIGVFEVEENRLISIQENLTKGLGEPLLFEKTTEKYIEKTRTNVSVSLEAEKEVEVEVEAEKTEEKAEEVEVEADDDIFSLKNQNQDNKKEKEKEKGKIDRIKLEDVFTKDKIPPYTPSWPEETEEESKKIREEYIKSKSKSLKDNWVQSTMQNKHFEIQPNEGAGDCFFAVIRDAYLYIGYHTSVQKLRLLLSQEVNSELFRNYKIIYDGIINGQEIDKHEMDLISKQNQNLKKQAQKGGQSKEILGELISGGKELKKKYTKLQKKSKVDEDLLGEFQFMKYVKTVDDLKNYVRTSDYWADTWAISTLEYLLNVKIIILEKSTDKDAIMICGQLNNDISTFSPKYYIIANYTNGNHYELITYKKKGLLTFQEIPYSIKALIVNKCMERNAGPYAIIPAFNDFRENLGISISNKEEEVEINTELYDDDIVFVYHSRSDASKKPGKGTGEKIPTLKISDFIPLLEEDNWRQKLDDSWITAFTFDGFRWSSVSHYLLAILFKKSEPEIFKEFSLDGNDKEIAKDFNIAKDMIEKKTKGKEGRFFAKYKIVLNSGELGDEDIEEARKGALMAKFSQNADLNTLLRNTRNAKLIHFTRKNPGKVDVLLMEVRKTL
jgi:hypothetical protein